MAGRGDQRALRDWTLAIATGDFERARALLLGHRSLVPDPMPWQMELTAALFLAGNARTRMPAAEEVRRLAGRSPESDAALSRVASLGTRAAVLAFDRQAAQAWEQVHELLANRGPEPSVRARIAAAWRAWVRGPGGDLPALEALGREARALGLSSCVIEIQTVEALLAVSRGDVAAATAAARRASRMARSEAAPLDELLANLVLARVRRVAGGPHLATHILGSLALLASTPFLPWLSWESRMAGARGPTDLPSCPASRAAAALDRTVRCAADGKPTAFDAAAEDLADALAGWADLDAERADLVAALDPRPRPVASQAMGEWIAGNDHVLPRGLHGIALRPGDTEETGSIGYVVGRPGVFGRRILAAGVPLVAAGDGSTVAVVQPSRRPQERTDAAIALLTLVGGALDEREFFRELYGLDYQRKLHRSILSTLVHRIRSTLDGRAVLHREEGCLWLESPAMIVAWDPRCYRPLEDRILRQLTHDGPGTAKAAAERLGVPLRTIQAILGELVTDGACVRERRGRVVEYTVEDTTFSEPTITRARAWRNAAAKLTDLP